MEELKLYWNAFKNIWKDLLFKIAGTLFPFYIGAFILFLLKKDVVKVFDNQSFVLYSSTFLFTTLYLWYKTLNNKKNEIAQLLLFVLLMIVIALLYSFSLIESQEINISTWAYIVFGVTLITYVLYECKHYIKIDSTKSYKESNKQFFDLKESFNNFREHE